MFLGVVSDISCNVRALSGLLISLGGRFGELNPLEKYT